MAVRFPVKLTPGGKLILTALMFIGRAGPLTWALFTGMKDRKHLIRYPWHDVISGHDEKLRKMEREVG